MTRGGAASDRERIGAPAGARLRPGPGRAVRPGHGGRAVRRSGPGTHGPVRSVRAEPDAVPDDRPRRAAQTGDGPRGQGRSAGPAGGRDGGHAAGGHGRGGDAVEPSVPGQRSPRGRGAHRATGMGKLRPRSRLSKGLAAGGLTVGVAAGAFSGVAAASSDALPGDSLYGLKRGMEDLKRGMADDDSDRGGLYLDQASTRLSEARRLIERDRSGPLDHESMGEIRRALSGVRHDASEGHRLLHEAYERDPDSLGPIQTLSAFSQSHRDAWGALRDRLPAQLGDVSRQVSSVFDAIDEEVDPLRSLLPEPPHGRARAAGRTPAGPPPAPPTQTARPPRAPPTAPPTAASPAAATPSRPPRARRTTACSAATRAASWNRPRKTPAPPRPTGPPHRPSPTSRSRPCSQDSSRSWASRTRTRISFR